MHCLELGKLDLNRSVASLGLLSGYYISTILKMCHVNLDPKHYSTLETMDCSDSQPFYNAHLVSLAGKKKGKIFQVSLQRTIRRAAYIRLITKGLVNARFQ
ncbi:uncharacterized protein TrAtP1_010806 [Trichoderma atroviride]|uniref:uncharacterized protein n=1 Tax=Hypocrea atroviridis TaxID=63577 RepID=UPI003331C63B|nr:hypothetical protein TrAtP1_010806 [Trichoderma atroviride]